LLRSVDRPWLICTPDAFQKRNGDGPGTVQAKLTSLVARWEEEVPMDVWCQCQHECAVTGTRYASAVVLLAGTRLVWKDLPRDDRFIDEVLWPTVQEFMRAVESQEPYTGNAHLNPDATKRAFRALYPKDSGETVALDAGFVALHDELDAVKANIKQAEERKTLIENEFRLALKDASYGLLPNGVRASLTTTNVAEQVIPRKAYSTRTLRFSKPKR
jgi:predicted phage-related endonuclease